MIGISFMIIHVSIDAQDYERLAVFVREQKVNR